MNQGYLLEEDFPFIDDVNTYRKLIQVGNIWKFTIDDCTHFYMNSAEKESRLELMQDFLPYENTIVQTLESSDQSFTVVYIDLKTGMYKASVILSNKRCTVPVYESAFPFFDNTHTRENYIHMRDENKKLHSALVTMQGDVYKVKVNGVFTEGFSIRKFENFVSSKKNKIPSLALCYQDKPVYLCNYGFYNTASIKSYLKFQTERKKRIDDSFYQILEDFDDDFMEGKYGPQKALKRM